MNAQPNKAIPQHSTTLLKIYHQAGQKGDNAAKVNAAVLYAWGENVTHDKMKAYEYLKSALKAGKSEASGYLDRLCKESAWVCKD